MNLLFMEYKRELTAKIVLTSFLPPTPWPLSFLFLHFIFAAIEKVGAKTVILLSAAPFSKSRNKSYFTFEKSLYLGHCFCRSHKRDCEMRIDEKPQTNFKVRISGWKSAGIRNLRYLSGVAVLFINFRSKGPGLARSDGRLLCWGSDPGACIMHPLGRICSRAALYAHVRGEQKLPNHTYNYDTPYM